MQLYTTRKIISQSVRHRQTWQSYAAYFALFALLAPATRTESSNFFRSTQHQERSGEEEIRQRIAEAVTAAVAAPNDLTKEVSGLLRLQVGCKLFAGFRHTPDYSGFPNTCL